MNILQKGLALVAVPLLFQVGFIYVLTSQLDQAENEKRRVEAQKELVDRIDAVYFTFMEAGGHMSSYCQTRNHIFLRHFEQAMKRIPVRLAEARHVVESVPTGAKEFANLENLAATASSELMAVEATLKPNMTFSDWQEISYRRERITPLMGQFAAIMQDFQASEEAAEQKESTSRGYVRTFLFYGLAANFFIAIALAVWFGQGTIRRLRVLMENAQRIGAGLPLQPVIGGTDEIRHLDEVMHDVSLSLSAAREREKELDSIKEEFYAMLTHDLRSPLTSVYASIGVIRAGATGDVEPKMKSMLDIADRGLQRVLRLVNEFLDIKKLESEQQSGPRSSLIIDDAIQGCLELVRPQADSKQQQLVYQATGLSVLADASLVDRVLTNLLTNAIKFSPDHSDIVVSAVPNNQFARIEVADSGRGVPDEDKMRVFERFAQVKSEDSARGTGLGLPICKLIVEQHGGTIGITDAPKGGSIFWFELPLASAQSNSQLDTMAVPPAGTKV